MNRVMILGLGVALMIAACSKTEKNDMEWSYNGETSPEHWAEIEKIIIAAEASSHR